MINTALTKDELRQQLRDRLKLVSPSHRQTASTKACALLKSQAFWQRARSILFYAPLRDEIDLLPLLHEALAHGKMVALPRFMPQTADYAAFVLQNFSENCSPGKFGIMEPNDLCAPIPLNQLDLVLVPGLGFDPAGHRLGKGRGFYDRLLVQVAGMKCGVAFDEQVVGRVPTEPHDIRLNCILTPTRWLQIAG